MGGANCEGVLGEGRGRGKKYRKISGQEKGADKRRGRRGGGLDGVKCSEAILGNGQMG